jgi:hypothetical protein
VNRLEHLPSGREIRRKSEQYGTDGRDLPLWDRVLKLVNQDLVERRSKKLFVEIHSEAGSCRKEIGDLSTAERQSLHPALRQRVVEQLLDRYLAEQGNVDLVTQRRVYTKKIQDLTPEDLPALVEADRRRVEESQEERERADFVREVRAGLARLRVTSSPSSVARVRK